MQISQIYFTDNDEAPPEGLLACSTTIKNFFPQLTHVVYDIPQARELLKTHLGNEVLAAFDKFKPYTYKADLFRYCTLYANGGWYFDMPIRCFMGVAVPENVETVAFRDTLPYSGTTWSCNNALLYAKQGSEVMRRAIESVVANSKKNYYGTNALCPTGPVLMGKVFAEFGESENYVFGDYMFMTPLHHYKNPAFVLPNGQLFALGKEQFVDLSTYGSKKCNSYVKLWNDRDVYN
ncbi:MAG: glycosyltransferase [Fluviibacter phosphoraccumulans]